MPPTATLALPVPAPCACPCDTMGVPGAAAEPSPLSCRSRQPAMQCHTCPDEELPACPEEFDDFVTFEASGFPGERRGSLMDTHPLPCVP